MYIRKGRTGWCGRAFAGVFAFGAMAGPGFSQADLGAYCTQYATAAVQQQQENIELGCGFESLRWTDNGGAALIWCMAAGAEAAGLEDSIRETKLAQCRAAGGQAQGGQQAGGNGGGQQGGGQQGGGDSAPQNAVFPEGIAGPGVNCVPEERAKGAPAQSQDGAIINARMAWEDWIAGIYGNEFANMEAAADAEYRCQIRADQTVCEAVGRACRGPDAPVQAPPQQGAANGGDSQPQTLCQDRSVSVQALYKDPGNRHFWEERVRLAWEQEAARQYGWRYARFAQAQDVFVGCQANAEGTVCVAEATACWDQRVEMPRCQDTYYAYTDDEAHPMTYAQLETQWSKDVRLLYGPDYADWNNSKDGGYNRLDSDSTVLYTPRHTTIRLAFGKPCLP